VGGTRILSLRPRHVCEARTHSRWLCLILVSSFEEGSFKAFPPLCILQGVILFLDSEPLTRLKNAKVSNKNSPALNVVDSTLIACQRAGECPSRIGVRSIMKQS